MNYKTEFPNFDYIPFLASHIEWYDTSWHNDICPSFERLTPDKFTVKVFFEYKTPEKREIEDNEKYYVALYNKDNEFIKDLLITDYENEVRLFLISIEHAMGSNL